MSQQRAYSPTLLELSQALTILEHLRPDVCRHQTVIWVQVWRHSMPIWEILSVFNTSQVISRYPQESEIPVYRAKKIAVKPWHFFPWQYYNHSALELWQSVKSDVAAYVIHIVNCGVFLCSCHQLFSARWSVFHEAHAKIYPRKMTTLTYSWDMNKHLSNKTVVEQNTF